MVLQYYDSRHNHGDHWIHLSDTSFEDQPLFSGLLCWTILLHSRRTSLLLRSHLQPPLGDD